MQVFDFFATRVEHLFPLDTTLNNPLEIQRDAHEMFLDSRAQSVLGRDHILKQVSRLVG